MGKAAASSEIDCAAIINCANAHAHSAAHILSAASPGSPAAVCSGWSQRTEQVISKGLLRAALRNGQ